MNRVGRRLNGWRRAKRITLHELAGVLEVSAAYLSAVENGRRRLNREQMRVVCDTLGVAEHFAALVMLSELERRLAEFPADDPGAKEAMNALCRKAEDGTLTPAVWQRVRAAIEDAVETPRKE